MKGSRIAAFLLGLLTGILIQMTSRQSGHDDTPASETHVDTIPYYQPVPKDTLVVKTIYKRLPIAGKPGAPSKADTIRDSILVEIPIEQRHYKDSTLEAWISGYNAAIDSLFVYPKTTTITRNVRNKCNIGIQGGIGYTPKGIQPYLGIGIQLNLK